MVEVEGDSEHFVRDCPALAQREQAENEDGEAAENRGGDTQHIENQLVHCRQEHTKAVDTQQLVA